MVGGRINPKPIAAADPYLVLSLESRKSPEQCQALFFRQPQSAYCSRTLVRSQVNPYTAQKVRDCALGTGRIPVWFSRLFRTELPEPVLFCTDQIRIFWAQQSANRNPAKAVNRTETNRRHERAPSTRRSNLSPCHCGRAPSFVFPTAANPRRDPPLARYLRCTAPAIATNSAVSPVGQTQKTPIYLAPSEPQCISRWSDIAD